MDQMYLLINKISNDVAAVKATGAESTRRLGNIEADLELIKKEISNLRVRVAGVAAVVSILSTLAYNYISRLG